MRNPDKYMFNAGTIEKECYSLLAYFMASPSVHTLAKDESQSALRSLPSYERWLVKEALISIAIKVRMIDDLMKAYDRTSYLPTEKVIAIAYLGKTTYDGIREACNKIIHATNLVYPESADNALHDQLILSGNQGNQDWIAHLTIISFVRAACDLCRKYDEDWEVSGYA